MKLYDYFRSSAAYRVRIALNLKGIAPDERTFVHLRMGNQRAQDYLALNPQGLVPALALDDGHVLTQSLAIIEYLDETHPAPPFLPAEPAARARVRGIALAIACEIHPLNNLRVLKYLIGTLAGTSTGSTSGSRRSSESSRTKRRPPASVTATRRRSPTSASCRRLPTRAGSTSIFRRTRR
jgi:maleylacetoacetate isomerase